MYLIIIGHNFGSEFLEAKFTSVYLDLYALVITLTDVL